jgi:hypothetical protein
VLHRSGHNNSIDGDFFLSQVSISCNLHCVPVLIRNRVIGNAFQFDLDYDKNKKPFDIAGDLLLMDSNKYLELRACSIYSKEAELRRFRQLVVNCGMAADLFDKEPKEFRDNR